MHIQVLYVIYIYIHLYTSIFIIIYAYMPLYIYIYTNIGVFCLAFGSRPISAAIYKWKSYQVRKKVSNRYMLYLPLCRAGINHCFLLASITGYIFAKTLLANLANLLLTTISNILNILCFQRSTKRALQKIQLAIFILQELQKYQKAQFYYNLLFYSVSIKRLYRESILWLEFSVNLIYEAGNSI